MEYGNMVSPASLQPSTRRNTRPATREYLCLSRKNALWDKQKMPLQMTSLRQQVAFYVAFSGYDRRDDPDTEDPQHCSTPGDEA